MEQACVRVELLRQNRKAGVPIRYDYTNTNPQEKASSCQIRQEIWGLSGFYTLQRVSSDDLQVDEAVQWSSWLP